MSSAPGVDLILKYFPSISETQVKQFTDMYALYLDWNVKVNVISRKDIDLLYERHVLHSLGIAKVISFKEGTAVMDVGTGGGFPGIPLAIMFPEATFTLVDSINKKINVVKDVAMNLGLTNLQAHHARAEDVIGKFDFIVSRAVTEFDVFYRWVKPKIKKEGFNELANGILYLKGGDISGEVGGFKNVKVIELSDYFLEEFFETKKVVYLPYSGK